MRLLVNYYGVYSNLGHPGGGNQPFHWNLVLAVIYLVSERKEEAGRATYPDGPAPTIKTSVRTVSPMLV